MRSWRCWARRWWPAPMSGTRPSCPTALVRPGMCCWTAAAPSRCNCWSMSSCASSGPNGWQERRKHSSQAIEKQARASAAADARMTFGAEGWNRYRDASLRSIFFAVFFFLFFEMLFHLGALLGFDVVALLPLGVKLLFGAQQFDEGLFGAVALLKSSPDDAEVAAGAIAVARSHGLKQPLHGLIGHEKAESLAARVQIALLAQGDHLFNQRTDSLGLGHGGLHAVFHEDGRDQVAQQGAAMAGVASELESCVAMAHVKLSFDISV